MTSQNSSQDFAPKFATGIAGSIFGIATAMVWATSPVFIKAALKDLPFPILV